LIYAGVHPQRCCDAPGQPGKAIKIKLNFENKQHELHAIMTQAIFYLSRRLNEGLPWEND
jgi:hypothetical protein